MLDSTVRATSSTGRISQNKIVMITTGMRELSKNKSKGNGYLIAKTENNLGIYVALLPTVAPP